MRKLIVTEWLSLDGIFDSASMDQWFNPYHTDSRAKYIQDTICDCEIMLYGRITYETMYPYWSALKNNEMGVAEKLNKVKKYVVSSTLNEAKWENTTIIKKDAMKEIEALKAEQGGDILVQGSVSLVRSLLEAGLVDELKLLVNPHIMGAGERHLYDGINTPLELIKLEQLEKGVVVLVYKPVKK